MSSFVSWLNRSCNLWANCVRSVQYKAVRQPKGLNFNIYLWILWQTGGSYSIISHVFFFFTKFSKKKNSYRPGKNAVTSNFSLFRSLMLAASPPSPRIGFRMHYVQKEERLECGLDKRELHISTATWLGSAVDIQLSRTKRTKTVTHLWELYSGVSSVHTRVFFMPFDAFSAWSRVKGLLEKGHGQII